MRVFNWWVAIALALPSVSIAADAPTLNLQQVRLVEFARLVFSEVLREDYIFDAAFLAEPSEVTVDARNLPADEARRLVVETARASGFVVEKLGRVWRFGRPHPAPAVEPDVFFYRPKHRSVAYLADLIGALFPGGSFSFQRGAVTAVPGAIAGAVPAGYPARGIASPGSVARLDGVPVSAGPGIVPGPVPGMPPHLVPVQPQVSGSMPGLGMAAIDAKVDAFIFRGTTRDVERLRGLLEQLDIGIPEVVVRAVIYEVRKSSVESSAVGLAASLLDGKVGISYGPQTAGANSLTLSAGSFRAVISAFASDGRFRAVSSPTLRVQSGESARFSVGDETPVLASVAYPANGSPVQSVEYRPSGVIFDVKPIAREDVVQLEVKQQISSFVATSSGVNNSPTLLKRELSTVLGARSGEVVVIGGLEDSRSSSDRTGLSFLPRFMDGRGNTDDKTEVLLVLDVQRVGL